MNDSFLYEYSLVELSALENASSTNLSSEEWTGPQESPCVVTSEKQDTDEVHYIYHSIKRYYIPIIVVVGVVGNILIGAVIFLTPLKKRTSSYLLLSRAVADACFLLNLLVNYSMKYSPAASEWFTVDCRAQNYVHNVSSSLSIWFTVGYTVERYIAVHYPTLLNSVRTPNRTRVAILSSTCLFATLNLYIFFTFNENCDCNIFPAYKELLRNLLIVEIISCFLWPFFIILTMNILIVRHLLRRDTFSMELEGSDESKSTLCQGRSQRSIIGIGNHLKCQIRPTDLPERLQLCDAIIKRYNPNHLDLSTPDYQLNPERTSDVAIKKTDARASCTTEQSESHQETLNQLQNKESQRYSQDTTDGQFGSSQLEELPDMTRNVVCLSSDVAENDCQAKTGHEYGVNVQKNWSEKQKSSDQPINLTSAVCQTDLDILSIRSEHSLNKSSRNKPESEYSRTVCPQSDSTVCSSIEHFSNKEPVEKSKDEYSKPAVCWSASRDSRSDLSNNSFAQTLTSPSSPTYSTITETLPDSSTSSSATLKNIETSVPTGSKRTLFTATITMVKRTRTKTQETETVLAMKHPSSSVLQNGIQQSCQDIDDNPGQETKSSRTRLRNPSENLCSLMNKMTKTGATKNVQKSSKSCCSNRRNRRYNSTTIMLVVTSSVFLVLHLPSIALRTYFFATAKNIEPTESLLLLMDVFDHIDFLHYSINFFLYCFCGSTFRHHTSLLFKK